MEDRLKKESLSDEEVDILYDIVETTANILEKNNIRYTIEGGTLLGAVRNGGLIPHDNDADFDILESDIPKILSLKEEFAIHNLIIIITPGWGLQISHKDSPNLEPELWSMSLDNLTKLDPTYLNYDPNIKINNEIVSWTSKWPFLDLISICKKDDKYVLAQDVAYHDYPNYYLTKEDWETDFDRIAFGHLKLFVISGKSNRENYLDRNYPQWRIINEMIMDHRKNIYFDVPIRCPITEICYRKKSKK